MEKPFINLLWSGTLLMALGFGLSVRQRGGKGITAETPDATDTAATARKARPQPVS
jgi:cytochrome c-type biogenesis protein CcmF